MKFIEDTYRQRVQPILDEIRPALKDYLDPNSIWNHASISSTVSGFTLYLARAYHLLHSSDMHVTQSMLDCAEQNAVQAKRDIKHAIRYFRHGNIAWTTANAQFDLRLTTMIDPTLPKNHPSQDDLVNYIRSI